MWIRVTMSLHSIRGVPMAQNWLEKLNICVRLSIGAFTQELTSLFYDLGIGVISCRADVAANWSTEERRRPHGSICVFRSYLFFPYFDFQEGPLPTSAQAAVKHSDLFSSSPPSEKGAKGRTKTVLSLFDEEGDKAGDQSSIQAPQKEVGKVSKKQIKVFRKIK